MLRKAISFISPMSCSCYDVFLRPVLLAFAVTMFSLSFGSCTKHGVFGCFSFILIEIFLLIVSQFQRIAYFQKFFESAVVSDKFNENFVKNRIAPRKDSNSFVLFGGSNFFISSFLFVFFSIQYSSNFCPVYFVLFWEHFGNFTCPVCDSFVFGEYIE